MVRLGVVGAGRVAQLAHLSTFGALAGVQLVALADLRAELAARVAARYGITRVYPTHAALLADAEVDAVVVVVQRTQTAAIVRDALRARKHVLSEKPMALSLTDARENVALARDAGLTYAVGYMKRHEAAVADARALVARWSADGSAGAPCSVRLSMDGGDDGAGSDWLMTEEPRADRGFAVTAAVADVSPKSAFDTFLNVFSHTTNLARFITGAPLEIEAASATIRATAFVGRAGPMALSASFAPRAVPGWHERVEVLFERGSVAVHAAAPFDRAATAWVEVQHPDGESETWDGDEWAFMRQARAFVDDVAGAREPIASGADALADVALAETVWRCLA